MGHIRSPLQVKGNHKQERRSGPERHETLERKGESRIFLNEENSDCVYFLFTYQSIIIQSGI